MGHAPILRVAEIRAVESAAVGQPLMQRAGVAAASVARTLLADRPPRVLVLAGPGNNGGDAFVVARTLRSWFFDTVVAFAGDSARLPAEAAAAHAAWRADGGTVVGRWDEGDGLGLIVDGMFGIGHSVPRRAGATVYAEWIIRANACAAPILALDVPSGLGADTGVACGPTIRARGTATFIALKPGLLTLDGPDHCGDVSVHSLELEREIVAVARGQRIVWPALRAALPAVLTRVRRNVHKGSFGTVAIVGGSSGMVGAALLAGRAALHLGAGKAVVGLMADAGTGAPAIDWMQPELMLRGADDALAADPSATVIGPGLGTDDRAGAIVARAIATATPLVIDADALTLIAHDAKLKAAVAARSAPTVMTPHPAEAARLGRTTTDVIQSDRVTSALSIARDFNATVVLKGVGSIVAFTDGRWSINTSGNPGLATAGSGDVLAGMLGALLAQAVPLAEAIELGVCLHGAAADLCVDQGAGPLGLTASELAPAARALINAAARDVGRLETTEGN